MRAGKTLKIFPVNSIKSTELRHFINTLLPCQRERFAGVGCSEFLQTFPANCMVTVSITEVGDFETLTYPPTKNYNSERNNRTGTRPQFWLYFVIGRLFL